MSDQKVIDMEQVEEFSITQSRESIDVTSGFVREYIPGETTDIISFLHEGTTYKMKCERLPGVSDAGKTFRRIMAASRALNVFDDNLWRYGDSRVPLDMISKIEGGSRQWRNFDHPETPDYIGELVMAKMSPFTYSDHRPIENEGYPEHEVVSRITKTDVFKMYSVNTIEPVMPIQGVKYLATRWRPIS